MGDRPVGKAYAVQDTEHASKYIELGAVFRTKSGNYIFSMEVEPIIWKDAYTQRRVLVKLDEHRPKPEDGDLPF